MAGPYSALARVGLTVVVCNAALDGYGGRGDALSAALVLACFSFLVILTGLFLRAFARVLTEAARGGATRSKWTTLLTAMFAFRVAPPRFRANTWAAGAGLGQLTCNNSGLAIYGVSYLALVLLFACLRAYERAPPGPSARERARRAVWSLRPHALQLDVPCHVNTIASYHCDTALGR
ncbi:unnamed protein product [Urochloa humidicola]